MKTNKSKSKLIKSRTLKISTNVPHSY